MKPKRIQRQRTKGWRMPENTVYVGRPSVWGNYNCDVEQFKKFIENNAHYRKTVREKLKGKDLACWCPLWKKCHADILLEIANSSG